MNPTKNEAPTMVPGDSPVPLEPILGAEESGRRRARSVDSRAQRRAALNLMEDAVEARRETEKLIAGLRESEERLARELEATRQLQSISALLIEGGDTQGLYQKIVDAAVAIMRSDMASMQTVDEAEDALRLLAFRGFDPDFGRVFELVRPDAKTSCSVARSRGHRVVVPDVETCDFMVGTPVFDDYRNAGIGAVQSTPLFSRDGRLLGMISTHWRAPHGPAESDLRQFDILARQAADLIERKQAEEQLRRQAETLSDLHRRKDEFLAMLSHELRNPLAPIANAVHLLRLQRESESATAQQARAIIERQVGQLKHLVDDLLEVSRITSGRLQLRQESVSVAGIVEGAVETARPLIEERRHKLSVSVPPEPLWLHADAARIEQVVVNLLTNAAKYTDEGGHIRLTVQLEGGAAVLRVRDTGIGIAPELLPRIFDLFTQAERALDRAQGGLGIGLSLVHRLVELHGGTVEAASAVGQGSEFVVRLPVTSGPSSLPSAADETTRPTGKYCRVLVVDDNVDSAESLALLLKASQHDVRTAHDSPTALRAAVDYRPDVVLLDIGLPGISGFEVARRMRQHSALKDTVLVAITGYGQERDRQRALEAGFDHHLVKPADFRQLQEILASVAERAA